MGVLFLAAALQVTPPLRLIGLRVETVGTQQKLIVEATGDWGPVAVTRDGRELVASLPVEVTGPLDPPPVAPPLGGIRLVRERGAVQLRVTADSSVPFEVQRTGRMLTLLFGTANTDGIPPDLLALYESMRPPAGSSEETFEPPASSSGDADAEEQRGLHLGPLRFSPALLVSYSRSDTSIDTPQPVRDSYLQAEPRLGSHLSLWDGRIRANYEPQLRMRSRFEKINRTSHEANAHADIPIGSRLIVRGSHHLSISTLDTTEVDGGREYFFELGRFRRNDSSARLQFAVGPRLSAVAGAGINRVDFEEQTSFFDYEGRRAHAGLEFMLTEEALVSLRYEYDEVRPPPERPVIEHRGHSFVWAMAGELMPLVTGDVSVGYLTQDMPAAGAGGRHYSGVTLRGNIVKEFSRGTRFALYGMRNTYLSSFEDNAFYLTNTVRATIDAQLPAGLSARAGGGYHWNSYRTVSSSLGAPRDDRIYGWTAGLSRPLNRWSYVRADYAWERRESNVPSFNNESTTLLVHLGIGMFESATQ